MAATVRPAAALALGGALASAARALELDHLAYDFLHRHVAYGVIRDLGFSPLTWLAMAVACVAAVTLHRLRAPGLVMLFAGLLAFPGTVLYTAIVIEALPVALPVGAALGVLAVIAQPKLLGTMGRRKKKDKRKD